MQAFHWIKDVGDDSTSSGEKMEEKSVKTDTIIKTKLETLLRRKEVLLEGVEGST